SHFVDAGEADKWADLFTPDGTFGNAVGHDALVEFAKRVHEQRKGSALHLDSNLMITPTPQGASGSIYGVTYDVTTKPPTVIATSVYTHVLVKTSNGWRLKSRTIRPSALPSK